MVMYFHGINPHKIGMVLLFRRKYWYDKLSMLKVISKTKYGWILYLPRGAFLCLIPFSTIVLQPQKPRLLFAGRGFSSPLSQSHIKEVPQIEKRNCITPCAGIRGVFNDELLTSGRTVDESRAWLKRICITWAILDGIVEWITEQVMYESDQHFCLKRTGLRHDRFPALFSRCGNHV